MATIETGAARVSERTPATLTGQRAADAPDDDRVVEPLFAGVCASVLVGVVIMAFILSIGQARPVATHALVAAILMGATFGSFLVWAFRLAILDSKKEHDH